MSSKYSSDVLNAMIQAGFVIEKMVERIQENFILEKEKAEGVQESAEGSAKEKLPCDFFVVARIDQ